MTAQASDQITYKGDCYAIAGVKGEGLFDPEEFGIKPQGVCTACYRGFLCVYKVDEHQLVLDSLFINSETPFPPLFGIEPKAKGRRSIVFAAEYEGLHHPIAYSGGLLAADEFIRELYVHMGFHPPWKYRVIHELIFQKGQLVEEHDRSDQMAMIRERLLKEPIEPRKTASRDEVSRWIEKCFSLDY